MTRRCFKFLNPAKTAIGKNALGHLPFDLYAMNVHKPLVITSQKISQSPAAGHLVNAFKESRVTLGLFDNIDPSAEPAAQLDIIAALTHLFLDNGFDGIICLGGGIINDLSRMLNIAVSLGPNAIKSCRGTGNIDTHLNPLVFLPAGISSGNEVSSFLTVAGHDYMSRFLMPDMVVIDPVIFPGHTAGKNLIKQTQRILSNCFKVFLSAGNPMLRAYAGTAIKLIMTDLSSIIMTDAGSKALKNSKNFSARMALVSAINGIVISNTDTPAANDLNQTISMDEAARIAGSLFKTSQVDIGPLLQLLGNNFSRPAPPAKNLTKKQAKKLPVDMPDYFEFCCKVNIISGPDRLEKIPDILSAMNARYPMMITDNGVSDAGLADIVKNAVNSRTPIRAIETGVPPDSDLKTVNRIAAVYQKEGCDAIIAVGGGSVLDTAKGVNILVSQNARDLMQFTGAGALRQRLKPLIAVPTTAGTGSEVTLVAVIADPDKNRKMLFTSYFLLPEAAVIDPRMTVTLPPHITAATAMDAMSHAFEAFICLARNPLSDAHAIEAVTLISGNIMKVMQNPADTDARLALGEAATAAGIAFSNSMVGMVHTLGHAVGSVCHVPHGTCMAILLPYGLEYNLHKAEKRIARLLLPMSGDSIYTETPENKRAQKTIEAVRTLNQKLYDVTCGMHARCFKEVKNREGKPMVTRDLLPQIAQTALGDGSIFYNPEELDYDDFLMVLESAFSGEHLDLDKIKKG